VTGNARGFMCLWNFDQLDDRSLDQWSTVEDFRQANPKKKTVKKMRFSSYGDKICGMNMDGTFNVFAFDLSEDSKQVPIFEISRTKEMKFHDFELLNGDTVFCMSSLKPKKLWIYDSLLRPRRSLVQEVAVGGNVMHPRQVANEIFTFNEKPGQMNAIDLRMGRIVNTYQLHSEELTAVCLNYYQNTLVAGFKGNLFFFTTYFRWSCESVQHTERHGHQGVLPGLLDSRQSQGNGFPGDDPPL